MRDLLSLALPKNSGLYYCAKLVGRMPEPTIRHISDTARWAAVFRARESEKPNGLFRDPFARKLAGERGEQIAKATPFHQKNEWSWITRTYLFDKIITEQAAQGIEMVVNLAAGLDTRPLSHGTPRVVEVG